MLNVLGGWVGSLAALAALGSCWDQFLRWELCTACSTDVHLANLQTVQMDLFYFGEIFWL